MNTKLVFIALIFMCYSCSTAYSQREIRLLSTVKQKLKESNDSRYIFPPTVKEEMDILISDYDYLWVEFINIKMQNEGFTTLKDKKQFPAISSMLEENPCWYSFSHSDANNRTSDGFTLVYCIKKCQLRKLSMELLNDNQISWNGKVIVNYLDLLSIMSCDGEKQMK